MSCLCTPSTSASLGAGHLPSSCLSFNISWICSICWITAVSCSSYSICFTLSFDTKHLTWTIPNFLRDGSYEALLCVQADWHYTDGQTTTAFDQPTTGLLEKFYQEKKPTCTWGGRKHVVTFATWTYQDHSTGKQFTVSRKQHGLQTYCTYSQPYKKFAFQVLHFGSLWQVSAPGTGGWGA